MVLIAGDRQGNSPLLSLRALIALPLYPDTVVPPAFGNCGKRVRRIV